MWPCTLTVWLLLAASLVGCSSAPARDDPPAGETTTAATPTPTPSMSKAPSKKPSPRATRTGPPPADIVGPATAAQRAGLVRVVADIGNGRSETSTGMVLSENGTVVTNNHGVEGAGAVQVRVMSTGQVYDAQVAATDPGRDVALLRLPDARGLATVTLARRDAAVGDRVTVVGDAEGYTSTFAAATGTVLALDQTLVTQRTDTKRAERLTGLLLTSSDVALGESGGPTYGSGGRVVAMTTATVPRGKEIDGVGIPVSTLLAVVRRLEG